jgi:hypothetical protein
MQSAPPCGCAQEERLVLERQIGAAEPPLASASGRRVVPYARQRRTQTHSAVRQRFKQRARCSAKFRKSRQGKHHLSPRTTPRTESSISLPNPRTTPTTLAVASANFRSPPTPHFGQNLQAQTPNPVVEPKSIRKKILKSSDFSYFGQFKVRSYPILFSG